MGFNHCYISTIENLQRQLDNVGLEVFVKQYRKYECLTGPSDSFRFLEQKIEQYELQQIQVVDKGKSEQTT